MGIFCAVPSEESDPPTRCSIALRGGRAVVRVPYPSFVVSIAAF